MRRRLVMAVGGILAVAAVGTAQTGGHDATAAPVQAVPQYRSPSSLARNPLRRCGHRPSQPGATGSVHSGAADPDLHAALPPQPMNAASPVAAQPAAEMQMNPMMAMAGNSQPGHVDQ